MNAPARLGPAGPPARPAPPAPAPEMADDARFREAFRYSPIGMALVDLDGAWLALNDAVTRIVGYDRPYLLERGFQDITHPDDLEADLDNVRRLVAGEFPFYRMEKRYIHRAGHQVWVDLTVTLVRDPDGTPRYFVSQIADITRRKEAERRQAESDARYRDLARSFPGGAVVMFDHDLRYTLADGAGLTDAGLDAAELEGRTIWEAFPAETAAGIEPQYRGALAGEESTMEVPFGDKVYYTRATPVRDADGGIVGGMVTTLDISDRVRSEEARARARKLEGLVRVTGGLAHEFNNRFTAILPALELIRMELGDDHPLAIDVDLVLDEAACAAAVVERLSAFSPRDTALVVRLAPADTLHELVAELAGTFPDGVRVRTDTDAAAVVEASPTGLRQAVHALLDNAVEAMPDGGTITLRAAVAQGTGAASDSPLLRGPHVLISVQDEGEGMAEEVRSKAFDPFFTTRDAAHRSGLGLTVVHAFVSRAGGRVAVISTPGRGTEVRLHLPLADEAGVDAAAASAVSPTATPPSD